MPKTTSAIDAMVREDDEILLILENGGSLFAAESEVITWALVRYGLTPYFAKSLLDSYLAQKRSDASASPIFSTNLASRASSPAPIIEEGQEIFPFIRDALRCRMQPLHYQVKLAVFGETEQARREKLKDFMEQVAAQPAQGRYLPRFLNCAQGEFDGSATLVEVTIGLQILLMAAKHADVTVSNIVHVFIRDSQYPKALPTTSESSLEESLAELLTLAAQMSVAKDRFEAKKELVSEQLFQKNEGPEQAEEEPSAQWRSDLVDAIGADIKRAIEFGSTTADLLQKVRQTVEAYDKTVKFSFKNELGAITTRETSETLIDVEGFLKLLSEGRGPSIQQLAYYFFKNGKVTRPDDLQILIPDSWNQLTRTSSGLGLTVSASYSLKHAVQAQS